MVNSKSKLLIVEDELTIALIHQSWLKKANMSSFHAATGEAALEELRTGNYKVVLLDLQLPDIDGLDIMAIIRDENISVTVVVVTSTGSIKTAVDVMRAGAYDYVVKPAAQERLITTTRNALEREQLQAVVKEIVKPYAEANLGGFIGTSLPMISIYKTIEAVGRSKASVFITGETGTGKEVCAQAIHGSSTRKKAPFIALNCAAIPKDLIESEIFGHIKGAFSGATDNRAGAATAASGGTLFLDEICEMDLNLQSKLLRFLQTGAVQKVGSDTLEKVDVRILCATNRDPFEEVEEGRFREDLYYRLHVIPIHLPPLRERDNDVIEIAESFLGTMAEEEGKTFKQFTNNAKTKLIQHGWPGNVRELQNVVRNAIILNDGDSLDADMLQLATSAQRTKVKSKSSTDSAQSTGPNIEIQIGRTYDEIERDLLEATIDHCKGSIPRAAEMLQLSPSTIYRKREGWLGI